MLRPLIENRRFERYLVPQNTCVYLNPSYRFWGLVKNISSGGCCVEYLRKNHASDRMGIGSSLRLVLLNVGDPFRLSGVSSRIVYNKEVIFKKYHYVSIPVRLCGLEFQGLDRDSLTVLDRFFNKCEPCVCT